MAFIQEGVVRKSPLFKNLQNKNHFSYFTILTKYQQTANKHIVYPQPLCLEYFFNVNLCASRLGKGNAEKLEW